MNKEDLLIYKEKIANLSEKEQIKRNEYLRGLAIGDIEGPHVGYTSIDKPWLKYYSKESLNKTVPKMSIYQNMLIQTEKYRDDDALEFFGKSITYNDFRKRVIKAVKGLINMGVKKGDVVSVCLPNIPEVGYVFYAINYLGAVANMMDPRTNASTLEEQVNDSKSDLVICMDTVIDKFIGSSAKNIVSVPVLNSLPKFVNMLAKLKDKELVAPEIDDDRIHSYYEFIKSGKENITDIPKSVYDEDSPAVIAYTGGTTGTPKGVIVTNEAFNSMIVENANVDYGIEKGDRALNMAPPWTYYGLSNCFNSYLCMGVKSVLVPAFGPDDLGTLILKYHPNHVITVPSALVAVMKEKKFKLKKLDYLKTIIVGADKLDPTFEEKFNEFLKECDSKASITKGYGMTEVCAAAAYTINDVNVKDTVGIPYLFETIGVFDPDNPDIELPTGKQGELAIRGPKNMEGYFGYAKTKSSDVIKVHSDGSVWVHTGDIGHMDEDGKIFVDGRIKRMFTKSGFKIFPSVIEEQIMKCPDVENTAVVAVKDESNGYIIKAFIVLKEISNKSPDDVIAEIYEILKKNIYNYEIPDFIEAIDSLPLTGMNKIDFKKLEELANFQKKL